MSSLAISTDGRTLYTANCFSKTVTAVELPSGNLERPIHMGHCPGLLAVSDTTLYVDVRNTAVALSLRFGRRLREYRVSPYVVGLAVSPDNQVLYVSGKNSTAVTRIEVATGRHLKPIRVGKYSAMRCQKMVVTWLFTVEGVEGLACRYRDRRRGLPRMGVPTLPIRKTSTWLTVPSRVLT